MEERQLKCFLAIAELGSVTRAADRLDIAQPSLSQMLLRLEDELGIKLFERTSRGVIMTESGRIFREHAATILREIARAREEVRDDRALSHGLVSVGLPSSISTLIGTKLIVQAKERLPGLVTNVSEAMSGHIRRWLEDGSLDLGILYNVQDMRALIATQIAIEELFLVGPPKIFGDVDLNGVALEGVELSAQYPLILPTRQHGLRRFVEDRRRVKPIDLEVVFEVDSLPHIKTLISEGHGYSILAHAAIADELRKGKLAAAPITNITLRRSVYIVRNPAQVVTRASVLLADLLTSLMWEMIEQGEWLASRPATPT